MAKKNVQQTVAELLTPVIEGLGYRVWDVVYAKVGTEYQLEVTIDNDEGITIDDCECMHRAIDPLLDEADPIDTAYDLEVSSPGIERELRTDMHIDLSIGELVEMRFFTAIDGQKSKQGILTGRRDDAVLVEIDGEERAFPRSAIAKLSTVYEF